MGRRSCRGARWDTSCVTCDGEVLFPLYSLLILIARREWKMDIVVVAGEMQKDTDWTGLGKLQDFQAVNVGQRRVLRCW